MLVLECSFLCFILIFMISIISMTESRVIQKLYLVGDSNTQRGYENDGFVSKLSNEYIRKVDVVNRGFSGYTSEHLNIMIKKLLDNDNVPHGSIHTATILLGSNDAVLADVDSRHVPTDRYKENVVSIINHLKGAGVQNIILLSPPPVDDEALLNHFKIKYGATRKNLLNSDVQKYAEVCKQIASEENIHFINLHHDMMLVDSWRNYLIDGLHFSPSGYTYLFYKLKEVLDPMLDPLPMIYPEWSAIGSDPVKALR